MVKPATGTRSHYQKVVYKLAMEKDISIAALAEQVYMSPSLLYMKLRRGNLKMDEIMDIADALDTDVASFAQALADARKETRREQRATQRAMAG